MATQSAKTARIFAVAGVPRLQVRNNAGSLRVINGPDAQVAVEVTITAGAGSDTEAQRLLSAVEVSIVQDGDQITVETHRHHDFAIFGHWHDETRVAIVLTTPAQSDLDIKANAGRVEITGITGVLHLDANAAKATFSGVTVGGATNVSMNAGSLTGDLALAAGADARFSLNAGSLDLALPGATQAQLVASATAGSVKLDGWDVPVRHHTASARAEGLLGTEAAARLAIIANAGHIRLRRADGG